MIPTSNSEASALLEKIRASLDRIHKCERQIVLEIVEAGRLLIELEQVIPDGEFEQTVRESLDLSPSKSRKLRAIARHSGIAKRSHVNALPPHWSTIYELTHLSASQLSSAIRRGSVTPELQRAEAEQLVERIRSTPKKQRSSARSNVVRLPTKHLGSTEAPEWPSEPRVADVMISRGEETAPRVLGERDAPAFDFAAMLRSLSGLLDRCPDDCHEEAVGSVIGLLRDRWPGEPHEFIELVAGLLDAYDAEPVLGATDGEQQ